LQLCLSLALGTLALCCAALINGGPVMYPDTLNYLTDGHNLIRLTAPDNTRPVFYGLAIEFLHGERSAWPVIVAQALIVAHLVYLTARSVLGGIGPLSLLVMLGLIAFLSPVSWYVAHLLPDIFAGILGLSVFLLVFQRERLSRLELIYVVLLTVACVCFHLTDIVTGGRPLRRRLDRPAGLADGEARACELCVPSRRRCPPDLVGGTLPTPDASAEKPAPFDGPAHCRRSRPRLPRASLPRSALLRLRRPRPVATDRKRDPLEIHGQAQ